MTSGTSEWICDDDQTWHEHSAPVAPNSNKNIPECQPSTVVILLWIQYFPVFNGDNYPLDWRD